MATVMEHKAILLENHCMTAKITITFIPEIYKCFCTLNSSILCKQYIHTYNAKQYDTIHLNAFRHHI